MKRPKPVHQLTSAQFDAMFPNEDACCAYLVARRWPEGVHCPRCGAPVNRQVSTMPWHWQCKECAPDTTYRFSHLAGTIFENTNKPLGDWFKVAHLMLVSKKGMSALQIMRYMGFGSYKTAWLMCHKIRAALVEDIEQLGGIVEVDETFIGGKMSNRHKDKRGGKKGGGGAIGSGKTAVVGAAVRRKTGNVVCRVIENVRAGHLDCVHREAVSHKVRACSVRTNMDWLYKRLSARNIPTRRLTTTKSNTSSPWSTLRPSKASGRLSSVAASAPSIRSAKSTCIYTSRSFNSDTTTGTMLTSSERQSTVVKSVS